MIETVVKLKEATKRRYSLPYLCLSVQYEPFFCLTANIHSLTVFMNPSLFLVILTMRKNRGIYLLEGKEVSAGNNDELLYSVWT